MMLHLRERFRQSLTHPARYTVLIIVLVSGVALFFRLYPLHHNPLRYHQERAYRALTLQISHAIRQQLHAANPTLSPAELDQQLATVLQHELTPEHQQQLRQSARTEARKIVDATPVYLLGADSYHYLHLTKNLITQGTLSPLITKGQYFDVLMHAPRGFWRPIELHPMIGLAVYRLAQLIMPQITLMHGLAFTPIVLVITIITLFIILAQGLGLARWATTLSALCLVTAPIFIQRSSFGWYDTDPYNILIPLAVIVTLNTALRQKSHAHLWVAASGVLVTLYYFLWQGWGYLHVCIAGIFIALAIYHRRHKTTSPPIARLAIVYGSVSAVGAYLLITPGGLMASLRETITTFTHFLLLKENLWPDIFIAVGELKTISLIRASVLMGTGLFCALSLIGFITLLIGRHIPGKRHQHIMIAGIMIATALMAHSAERFVLFALWPAAVCCAYGLQWTYIFTCRAVRKHLPCKYHQTAPYALIIVLAVGLLLPSMKRAHITASGQMPIMNTVWEKALSEITLQTPPEAIITSWWSPGHFIKALSRRKVTVDGATLHTPHAFWVARFLLAESEAEAIAIARMLTNGGNRAIEILTDYGLPLDQAHTLIRQLLKTSADQAMALCPKALPDTARDELMAVIYATPPPSYCFIYNDLIANALALAFVDQWDFSAPSDTRAHKRGSKANIEELWQRAGGQPYIGSPAGITGRKETTLLFSNGVHYDLHSRKTTIHHLENAISGIPESILFVENGQLIEQASEHPTLKLSVLFLPDTNGSLQQAVIAPRRILRSMLFRLYYTHGVGLTHFKRLIYEHDPTMNTSLMLYQIIMEEK